MYLFLNLIILLSITGTFLTTSPIEKKWHWLNDIVKNIIEDSKIYQVLLMVDDNTRDSKIDYISNAILKSVPTQKITFSECNTKNAKTLSLSAIFANPRSTLFIWIQASQDPRDSLTSKIDFINEISPTRIRPKCLLFFLHQRKSILQEELLHYAWSKHLLDFTILELVQKSTKRKLLVNFHDHELIMHFYNPFTEDCVRKTLSENITFDLFPKKTLDLNRHKIKVGTFHAPPYVHLTRNSTKYPVGAHGNHVWFIKTISEAMNFVTVDVPADFENWGVFNVNRNLTTNLVRKIAYNQIQLLTNQGIMTIKGKLSTLYEDTNCVGMTRLCALVPISTNKGKSVNAEFVYMILVIGLLNLVSFLSFRFLKFDHFWTMPHILEIIIGMSVSQSPQKSAERIIFASVLLASFLLSSTTYYIFTNIILTLDKEVEIKTLQDLENSGLELWMPKNTRGWFILTKDTSLENLLKNAKIATSFYECMEYLANHRNISCVMTESLGRYAINKYRNVENNEPVMKFAGQCFADVRESIFFEPHSPYVERVNKILSRMIQAGLSTSFNVTSVKRMRNLEKLKKDKELSTNIRGTLTVILVVGFVSSILVFVCEIIVNYTCQRYSHLL